MAKIVLSGSEEKPMNTHGSPLAKSKRRGSVIRREALERFRKGKGGPLPGGEINNGSPRGVTSGELVYMCCLGKYRVDLVVRHGPHPNQQTTTTTICGRLSRGMLRVKITVWYLEEGQPSRRCFILLREFPPERVL